jgi:formate-dependent nitrite reductase membrane component NrfD
MISENPDLSNQEARKKTYEAYLRKSKPFWYWLYKFFICCLAIGVGSTVIIVLYPAYSEFWGISLLIFVIGFVGLIITRYQLDGSLLKPWWEIY